MEVYVARVESVRLVDDIDGSEAAETVEFALDGRGWEIDLNGENAKELREALAGFIESARPRGKVMLGAFTQVRATRTGTNRQYNQAVREWARANGHTVADRGRVHASVIKAYEQRVQ